VVISMVTGTSRPEAFDLVPRLWGHGLFLRVVGRPGSALVATSTATHTSVGGGGRKGWSTVAA
jgi:hypothetical protein